MEWRRAVSINDTDRLCSVSPFHSSLTTIEAGSGETSTNHDTTPTSTYRCRLPLDLPLVPIRMDAADKTIACSYQPVTTFDTMSRQESYLARLFLLLLLMAHRSRRSKLKRHCTRRQRTSKGKEYFCSCGGHTA